MPVHAFPLYFFKKPFNIILRMLTSFKDFLPTDFATKTLYVFAYCPLYVLHVPPSLLDDPATETKINKLCVGTTRIVNIYSGYTFRLY